MDDFNLFLIFTNWLFINELILIRLNIFYKQKNVWNIINDKPKNTLVKQMQNCNTKWIFFYFDPTDSAQVVCSPSSWVYPGCWKWYHGQPVLAPAQCLCGRCSTSSTHCKGSSSLRYSCCNNQSGLLSR